MIEHNIGPYPSDINAAIKELLFRIDCYEKNGLEEEEWAWQACRREVEAMRKAIQTHTVIERR